MSCWRWEVLGVRLSVVTLTIPFLGLFEFRPGNIDFLVCIKTHIPSALIPE